MKERPTSLEAPLSEPSAVVGPERAKQAYWERISIALAYLDV